MAPGVRTTWTSRPGLWRVSWSLALSLPTESNSSEPGGPPNSPCLLAGDSRDSHHQVMSASTQASWKQDLSASARRVSAGVVGGLLTGAVIGGVGGRLAMLVLRLTSDPSLRGMETDDGFIIGRFSGETGFLVFLTAAAGILGGLLYLIVRPWIQEQLRPWVMGVFGGIVGGALVIRPDGIDFTLLEPLTLGSERGPPVPPTGWAGHSSRRRGPRTHAPAVPPVDTSAGDKGVAAYPVLTSRRPFRHLKSKRATWP